MFLEVGVTVLLDLIDNLAQSSNTVLIKQALDHAQLSIITLLSFLLEFLPSLELGQVFVRLVDLPTLLQCISMSEQGLQVTLGVLWNANSTALLQLLYDVLNHTAVRAGQNSVRSF